MKIYLLALGAICLTCSSFGKLVDVDLGTGSEQPLNQHIVLGANDSINQLDLACRPGNGIHFSFLKVYRCLPGFTIINETFETECNWINSPVDKCEGVFGNCVLQVYQGSNYLIENEVNVTFQCLMGSQVHDISSPVGAIGINAVRPVYVRTPYFNWPYPSYPSRADFRCTVKSNFEVRLTIEFLYLDLEAPSNYPHDDCFDYLTFGTSGTKYCQGDLENLPQWQTERLRSMEIIFKSDISTATRGAWFAVYADSPSILTCEGRHTTTRTTRHWYVSTLFRETSTWPWDRTTLDRDDGYLSTLEIAKIVGWVLGGISLLCTFIAAVVCACVRRAAAQRILDQQRQTAPVTLQLQPPAYPSSGQGYPKQAMPPAENV